MSEFRHKPSRGMGGDSATRNTTQFGKEGDVTIEGEGADVYAAAHALADAIGAHGRAPYAETRAFQTAFNASGLTFFAQLPKLKVDGIFGPKTERAAQEVNYRRALQSSTATENA
jgi:hypothetical protein